MSYVLEFSASSVQMCGKLNVFFSSNRSQENMIMLSNLNNIYIPPREWADSPQNVTAAPGCPSEWTCVGQTLRPTSFRDSASHNETSLLPLSVRSAKARSVSLSTCRGGFTAKCLEVTQVRGHTQPLSGQWKLEAATATGLPSNREFNFPGERGVESLNYNYIFFPLWSPALNDTAKRISG